LLLLSGLEDLEAAHEGIVDRHHSSCIVELTAVVRSREESHKLALGKEFVAILYDLMRPANKINVVLLVKG
jgi:hypothetical protein